jgi:hypothetical protein
MKLFIYLKGQYYIFNMSSLLGLVSIFYKVAHILCSLTFAALKRWKMKAI